MAHVRGMRLKILEVDALIGETEVFALYPPMSVAMAKVFPATACDQGRHANVIDGNHVGDRGEILRVEVEDDSTMKSEAASSQDFPTLGELGLQILGIYEPRLDEL